MYHRLRSHKRTLFTIALILTFLMTLAPSVEQRRTPVSAVNITQPTNAPKRSSRQAALSTWSMMSQSQLSRSRHMRVLPGRHAA